MSIKKNTSKMKTQKVINRKHKIKVSIMNIEIITQKIILINQSLKS